jgi:hypothetical protein
MWLVFALVAIVCAGTMFMIRFLIREGSPSVCYWVIPAAAVEDEERAQEVFETSLEFDVPNLTWPPASTLPGHWRVGNPWETTARTTDWNQGGKKA